MDRTTRGIVAGTAGGLVAGAVLTGAMLGSQAAGLDKADDMVRIVRRAGTELHIGRRRLDERPSAPEEAAAQGLHLARSAAIGALYGAFHRRFEQWPVASGLLLGLGFYPLAFGVAGPLLGVTEKPWEAEPRLIAQRGLLHAVFGVITALVTRGVARRI
jgi:hypothetical protein